MNRRHFLERTLFYTTAGAVLAGPGLRFARAVEPVRKAGGRSRLALGLAAYSFRDYMKDTNHARERAGTEAKQIDLFGFLDYCAAQRCQGAELTSYYFPPAADREFCLKLRRHAFLAGVEISGSAVGNTFTHPKGSQRDQEIAQVKQWSEFTSVLGGSHLRVFAGSAQKGQELAEAKRLCIEALEECAEHAGRQGVFLGIENHGGITAEAGDLVDMVRSVRSPWMGINLDTGNFHTDDVYGDIARCAAYAVNVQFKEEIAPRQGARGRADFKRMIGILKDAGYSGYVTLEYESKPDPWDAVPRLLEELRGLL